MSTPLLDSHPKLHRRKKITIWAGFAFLVILIIAGTLIGWTQKVKEFVGKQVVLPGSTLREVHVRVEIWLSSTYSVAFS